ncbi:MAG: MafI family immunity protein [Alphaproteobacteria bacterium]|nr:MafI family immunity protein [Alphaproteobacteria bacterium]
MKKKIEKELRDLWKSIRGEVEPYPNLTADIEEFLDVGEWELALEHILDWSKAEMKHTQAQTKAKHIRAMMKQSPAKKTN